MRITKFLLLLALIWLNGSFAYCWPENVLVPFEDLRPTQMDVGLAHVEFQRAKIEKLAAVEGYAAAVESRVVPGYYGPDGKVYISDGHHWSSGAQRVWEQHPSERSMKNLEATANVSYPKTSLQRCIKNICQKI